MKNCSSIKNLPIEIQKSLIKAKIFYTLNYENYTKKQSREIVYLYDENYIILIVISKKYIFKYAYFPIEQYKWNKQNEDVSPSEFLDKCIQYVKQKLNIMWINHSETAAEFNVYPKDSLVIPFGNYIIDLSKSQEEIWRGFHTKHRNSVRRAEKSNIEIIFGSRELLNDFYRLDILTKKRSNLKIEEKQFYQNIIDSMEENTKIFVAYKDKKPQGTAFFYYNNASCYYIFGASCDRPETGAMELLHWKAILYMKEMKVKNYSFVGCRINEDQESKYHGIQRFKSRFGGELKRGYLFKIIFNKRYYKMYLLLKKIQAILSKSQYKGDIIDQEIYKWPELNVRR